MRRARPFLMILLAVSAATCTRVVGVGTRSPEPAERPDPSDPAAGEHEEFTGRVWLAGGDFAVLLAVDRTGDGSVSASLRIDELGLEASGEGTASFDRIFLKLRYGGACEGAIVVDARMVDQGVQGDGTLEARDCTGSESGPLTLARRPAITAAPTGASR